MKSGGLNPFTQAFIYKVFCLSKFLYGLEIMSLTKRTVKYINMAQNTLIRYMIGLNKYSHMSDLLVILRILNIGELITNYKLIFIKNLGGSEICKLIYEYLVANLDSYQKYKLSFAKDMKNLSIFFKTFQKFL
jgi:hypothetical protein